MSAALPYPPDLQLWLERQLSGQATPWEDREVRFLGDGEQPEMLDTSYLTEEDLADPDIRANVQAMAETNERILWAAEEGGELAFGYWQGADGSQVIVSLDSEGQYMVVPGRNITEALCASVSEFDDEEFAALASQARALADETAPGIAATLVKASSIAELPSPVVEGPGRFRDARYTALREAGASQPSGTEGAIQPANEATQDSASARGATGWDPALEELPQDLTRWRERAAAGETAPWDRFGVRFLAAGETPSEVTRALNEAAESGDRWALASAEATRLTAERATWVVEDGEGRSLGYWHGANDTPIGAASIVLLEPAEWFGSVPGRTLTEAMCVDLGEYEDEKIAELAEACRALGFDVQGDALDDFPSNESENPSSYYYERKREVEAADNAKRIAAATAAAAAAKARSDAAPQSGTRVSGELLTLIAALGHGADELEGKAAFALFDSKFTRSHFAIGDVTRTYFTASDTRAEFIYEEGALVSARVRVAEYDGNGAHARSDALVEGVGPETTRDEVLASFGEPEWSNDHADRFWIAADAPGKVFLRVEYVDGRVGEISVTLETAEN